MKKSKLPLIQFLFPVVFLILAAIILIPLMKRSVEKLTGGGPDKSLSSDTGTLSSGFGTRHSEGTKEPDSQLTTHNSQLPSGLHPDLAESAWTRFYREQAAKIVSNSQEQQNSSSRSGKVSHASPSLGSTSSKLQALNSQLSTLSQGSGSSAFQKIDSGGLSSANKAGAGGDTSKGVLASAMDALKNLKNLSFQAAKQASLDTAQNWTAKGFDLSPSGRTGLDYGKAGSLDRFNPNSIPGYLREDAMNLSKAKASAVPEAPPPVEDTADIAKKQQAMLDALKQDNLAEDFFKSIFSGAGNLFNSEGQKSSDPLDESNSDPIVGNEGCCDCSRHICTCCSCADDPSCQLRI
ncbi:MAG: hypothetical protein HY400_02995 [Elusimicrobia bacterium]|nr:hypothetical protein [Elusimicrobiota bacterium]